MSEWTVEEKRKILIVAGQEIDVTNMTANEVKNLIMEKAREAGYSRFRVLVNGTPVSPSEFESKFNEAERIEVVKLDIAG